MITEALPTIMVAIDLMVVEVMVLNTMVQKMEEKACLIMNRVARETQSSGNLKGTVIYAVSMVTKKLIATPRKPKGDNPNKMKVHPRL